MEAKQVVAQEAAQLALKLNGRRPGYLAAETRPGCVLRRETESPPGDVPLWGQKGSFILKLAALRARIETPGIFGGLHFDRFWLGFDAHAVDLFCRSIIDAHVRDVLKGKLVTIVDRS